MPTSHLAVHISTLIRRVGAMCREMQSIKSERKEIAKCFCPLEKRKRILSRSVSKLSRNTFHSQNSNVWQAKRN